MIKTRVFLLTMLMGLCSVYANDFYLTHNGKATSKILYTDVESPVATFAARELSEFLGKISAGDNPVINPKDGAGLYPIQIGTVSDRGLTGRCDSEKIASLQRDGFLIKIDASGVIIVGATERGLLYGVYELLKRYTGIRWLVPGDDGEYFTVQKNIKVTADEFVANPSLPFRTIFNGRVAANSKLDKTWPWMVRNNLIITHAVLNHDTKLPAREYLNQFTDDGFFGTHAFDSLLLNGSGIKQRCNEKSHGKLKEALFAEDPELFPLIDGKRFAGYANPCQSNLKVISYMAEALCDYVEKRMRPNDIYLIGNNDTSLWCECPSCRALIPPDELRGKVMSTRYWLFVNAIANEVWKKHPDAKLAGWAYQNFHKYPSGTAPDPRLHMVMLTYNNRCFRHKIDDVSCPTNAVFLQYFNEWRTKCKSILTTWEQLEYASGYTYQPIEKTYMYNVKNYQRLGLSGPMMTTQPMDGTWLPKWDGHISHEIWYTYWQTLYLGARLIWDTSRDSEKEYEEANSLYYGKAWEGGMRDFRALLTKAANETPGCAGYGHTTPIGRCLDQPGMEEKLIACLERAEKAALTEREKLHLARDKKYFKLMWLDNRKSYLENYRELKIYERTESMVIDAKADEKDWKLADVISNFKDFEGKGKVSNPQTYVRSTYDANNLYFFIESMEPEPEKMIANKTAHDAKLWQDNGIELFINHPDLGEAYYHLIVNHKGILYDAKKVLGLRVEDTSWESEAELKTATLSDRWVLEMRVPTKSLGMIARHGYVWKINVARSRLLHATPKPLATLSSIANGAFHDVANFLPYNMLGQRVRVSLRDEGSTTPFRNGNFNSVHKANEVVMANLAKRQRTVVDGIIPAGWQLNGKNDVLQMCLHPGSQHDYYLQLSQGVVYQIHYGDEKNVKIRFRAKGSGKLKFNLYRYRVEASRKIKSSLPTKTMAADIALGNDWQDLQFIYSKEFADEVIAPAFVQVAGVIAIDDVVITEAEPLEADK